MCARSISFSDKAIYNYRVSDAGCDSIVDERILGIFSTLEQTRSGFDKLGDLGSRKDLLVYLFISQVECNYKKIINSSALNTVLSGYLEKCRHTLNFTREEVLNNPYLNDALKSFFCDFHNQQ